MMKIQAHVTVSGNVQGVSFRYFVMNKAGSLGVTGWVRNTEDDRVEAIFEGEEDVVEKLIEFCRRGPSSARVSGVKVEKKEFTGSFEGFRLRY